MIVCPRMFGRITDNHVPIYNLAIPNRHSLGFVNKELVQTHLFLKIFHSCSSQQCWKSITKTRQAGHIHIHIQPSQQLSCSRRQLMCIPHQLVSLLRLQKTVVDSTRQQGWCKTKFTNSSTTAILRILQDLQSEQHTGRWISCVLRY